ncbi:MAG: HAD-IA family hydrolase [Candidatus Acidiferrales bacterium]|jgi:mannitol-1-/sugar-/sorbitol-6-phosphatase
MIAIACLGLLFDLDGTLVDSTAAVERVWTRFAHVHGFDVAEVVARAHGRPSMTTVKEYLPNGDHRAENEIVERGEIEDTEGVLPLPGSIALLAALPPGSWTIVTSCSRALAEARLRAAGMLIPSRMITSSDILRGKPDPEPFLKGAALLGFAPADCVAFEDAPAGIRSGKASGAQVVAFRTMADDAKLRECGADWIANNCADVALENPARGNGNLLRLLLKES